MPVPLNQAIKVGAYVVKQHLLGNKRYPLVLMLEPLFRCNLACAGCGKIDYPDPILNQRLSVQECLDAVDECGAPVVAIAGGEPLLHKELPEIVEKILAKGKFIYLCTNALLLDKRIEDYKPHKNFAWDVHLDGDKSMHDHAVSQTGVFDGADPDRVAAFLDSVNGIGVDGVMISPGYAYERAPDTEHFLNRQKSKQLFRDIFKRGVGKKWKFNQSSLFLDFLAGNQSYVCTPWGKPCRNVFGWQRPCYLLGEGYAKTFKELMEDTAWEKYGTGNYEKCADCMVHSGYEATSVMDAVAHPLKTISVFLNGPKTDGPMAPEIPLTNQRPAEFMFSKHVEQRMAELAHAKPAKVAAE